MKRTRPDIERSGIFALKGLLRGALKTTFASIFLFSALIQSSPAQAAHVVPEQTQSVPCGVLERFEGVVQILDAGRNRVVDVSRKVPISCGGSLSVGKGWAQLRHRDGHRFYLGGNSFIELPDAESRRSDGDHVVLFRGELYAQVEPGTGEFRVITANARARTQQGTLVVVYNRMDEETQLVTLERMASLENRFENSRRIEAKAGEATTLSFKLLRVTPSDPRAISVAGLKQKLAQFQIPEAEYNFAVRMAQKRLNRRFATQLVEENRAPAAAEGEKPVTGAEGQLDDAEAAVLAQEGEAKKIAERAQQYVRHLPEGNSANESALKRKWSRHLSAGEPAAEEILKSMRGPKGPGRAPASQESLNSDVDPTEEKEKRRLIEELSKIRAED